MTGKVKPSGYYMAKMNSVMWFLGYPVEAYRGSLEEVRAFSHALAFNKIDHKYAEDWLNMAPDQLLLLARCQIYGHGSVTLRPNPRKREKLDLIRLWLDENAHVISELRTFLTEQLAFMRELLVEVPAQPERPAVVLPETTVVNEQPVRATETLVESINHSRLVTVFANMVRAMGPLAELLASDDYTDEEREQLREEAGRWGVFRLKNNLVRLCGERARREMKEV
jgi:hypothetical protein